MIWFKKYFRQKDVEKMGEFNSNCFLMVRKILVFQVKRQFYCQKVAKSPKIVIITLTIANGSWVTKTRDLRIKHWLHSQKGRASICAKLYLVIISIPEEINSAQSFNKRTKISAPCLQFSSNHQLMFSNCRKTSTCLLSRIPRHKGSAHREGVGGTIPYQSKKVSCRGSLLLCNPYEIYP
jgi:hypothetical protein